MHFVKKDFQVRGVIKLAKERNYGVDFLRIFSMFMAVVLHVLGQGGILDAATPGSTHYWVAWFLEVAMYCAVDCFALISGYVLSVKNTKISAIASLWVQTFFYTTSLTLVFFLFFPGTAMTKFDVLFSFFPIITKQYWYVSAYLGMYILVPVLNVALANVKKMTLELVFIGMLVVHSGFSLKFDPFHLGEGCSVMWLSLLYLLGGYIRKYDLVSKVKKYKGWLLYISMTVLTFMSKYDIETFTSLPERDENFGNILISFVSPTVFLAAVGLFIATAQMKFPKPVKKIISVFSPAAFGVYLIHVCKPIWVDVFEGFSAKYVNYSPFIMILMVLAAAIVIYLACSIIELIRIRLFKLLGINYLLSKFEGLCKRVLNRWCCKFNNDESLLLK